MEPRTGAQRVFAVKAFYKNDDSFVITQHVFWREFGIHHTRAVPSGHAINLGSKLRGYWFDTKEERWECKNSMYTREHCRSGRRH